jgi:hypothetical protein
MKANVSAAQSERNEVPTVASNPEFLPTGAASGSEDSKTCVVTASYPLAQECLDTDTVRC